MGNFVEKNNELHTNEMRYIRFIVRSINEYENFQGSTKCLFSMQFSMHCILTLYLSFSDQFKLPKEFSIMVKRNSLK